MHKALKYVVVGAALLAAFVQGSSAIAAAADSTASFSLTAPTEVPGALLKPGDYTIQMVDHLSDRTVVRLDSVGGKTHVTFLGVNTVGQGNSAAHPVEWLGKSKGRHALRGFVFPNGTSVEFVYPKADAVALANANSASVVAIDPASEGRPELAKLTSSDMEMVNLWMLTPVRVGPGDGQKGIEAKRYQATVVTASQTSTPPTASASSVPSSSVRSGVRQSAPGALVARADVPARPIVRRTSPVVKQLPKTASDLPAVWLAGAFAMMGAGVLRARRVLRG